MYPDNIVLSRPAPPHITPKRYITEAAAIDVLRESYRMMKGELTRTLGGLAEAASTEDDEAELPPLPDDAAA